MHEKTKIWKGSRDPPLLIKVIAVRHLVSIFSHYNTLTHYSQRQLKHAVFTGCKALTPMTLMENLPFFKSHTLQWVPKWRNITQLFLLSCSCTNNEWQLGVLMLDALTHGVISWIIEERPYIQSIGSTWRLNSSKAYINTTKCCVQYLVDFIMFCTFTHWQQNIRDLLLRWN